MKRTILIIILCAVLAGGSLSLFFGMRARVEGPRPETMTTSAAAFATETQPTPQFQITILSDTTEAAFPTELNVTSFILNNYSQPVHLVEVLQTIPFGFNMTSVYLVMEDGSRAECHPAETSEGLRYSFSHTLGPREETAISVLLQTTSASISGKFTTVVRGTCDGNEIRSEGSEWIYVPPPRATCQDWDTIAFGEFLLENNVWGGPNEPHLQCMNANRDSFAWNVTRLSPSAYGLPSDCPQCIQPYYPEVIYGKKPWRTERTTANLPVALDSVESLEASMAAIMIPYAKYDLAFDIWITNSAESGPTDITDEVMIWLLWTSGLPGERVLDTVKDGYTIYEHRTYAYWNMTRIEGTERWTMHEFIIKKQGIPSRINILAFLDHLRKEKHDLKYLASIELGTEVWSGVGATEFSMYRIDLKTGANGVFIGPTVTHEHGIFGNVIGSKTCNGERTSPAATDSFPSYKRPC